MVTITGKDLSDFFRRNGILNMYATGRNSGQINKLKTHTQTMETSSVTYLEVMFGRALQQPLCGLAAIIHASLIVARHEYVLP